MFKVYDKKQFSFTNSKVFWENTNGGIYRHTGDGIALAFWNTYISWIWEIKLETRRTTMVWRKETTWIKQKGIVQQTI